MDMPQITWRRMHNLRLWGPPLATPEDVVRWLGAVQSQDYGPATWSIGERADGVDDAAVDRAYTDGSILRTHVLRPTWHFVTPADIRWLLALTGPRVHVQNAHMYRRLGLDRAVREHCTALVVTALERGDHLTRKEIAALLQSAGVATEGFRLAYILMSAELDGVICSGPPNGRQHTYALLDERVPDAPGPTGEAAVAELVQRYFASHGPATVKDLRWWSSLTVADITAGIRTLGPRLRQDIVNGVAYWSVPRDDPPTVPSLGAHLLQGYDEYLVGYSESKHVVDLAGRYQTLAPGTTIPNGVLILDGQLAGHWKRTVRSRTVTFEVALYEPFDAAELRALAAAADRHADFLGRTATVTTSLL